MGAGGGSAGGGGGFHAPGSSFLRGQASVNPGGPNGAAAHGNYSAKQLALARNWSLVAHGPHGHGLKGRTASYSAADLNTLRQQQQRRNPQPGGAPYRADRSV